MNAQIIKGTLIRVKKSGTIYTALKAPHETLSGGMAVYCVIIRNGKSVGPARYLKLEVIEVAA